MAVFQCQHPTADAIAWRINGTTLRDFPEGVSIVRSSDGLLTLTIMALSEYNSTVIECVAVFFDSSSEETSPAIMMVQGKNTIACHHNNIESVIKSLEGFM